jgi:catechol 2,3-dioxygenase-like lactoylglutathione lyase family enzyme
MSSPGRQWPGAAPVPERGGGVVITAIDHVQLAMPVGCENDAVAFYETILGVRQVAKPDDLARRGGCWFESATVKVHLGVEPDFRPARKAHPAFIVDNLDELVQMLSAAGHKLEEAEPLEGYDRIYVDDPFGNRIELLQVRP